MVKVIVSDFYDVLYNSLRREINTEVLKVLEKYYSKKIPLYLFTNSSLQFLHSENSKTPFLNIFKEYISLCEYNLRKPDHKTFEILLEKVNFKPKEILLIDDKQENIFKAQEFELRTIQYINPKQLEKDLEKFTFSVV